MTPSPPGAPERDSQPADLAAEIGAAAQAAAAELQRSTDAAREARQEAQQLQAAARPRRLRLAAALLIVALGLTSLNLAGFGFFRTASHEPTGAELEEELRLALYIEALEIEDFRQANGRLPDSLIELGQREDEAGWSFSKLSEEAYRLSVGEGNVTFSYDSQTPVESILGEEAP